MISSGADPDVRSRVSGRRRTGFGFDSMGRFDEFFQPLDEPSRRRAVDDIVIDRHRETEVRSRHDVSVHDAWFPIDSAHCQLE